MVSARLIVFDLLIPRTDDRTGVVHPPSFFDVWALETARRFGQRCLYFQKSGEAELVWPEPSE